MRRFLPRLLPLLLLQISLLLTPLARGEVIVDDPFTDGSAVQATGGDPLGLVYFRGGTANTLSVVEDAGIGAGLALRHDVTADHQKVFANFPPVTLAAAGETLTLSFDLRFASAPPNGSDGLRLGLYFSNDTRQTSESGGTLRYDDEGYGMTLNPGATGSFRVLKEEANGSDDILGGTVYFSSIGASAGSTVPLGTVKHTLTLQITRLANGGLQVQGQIDSRTPSMATVAAGAVLTYIFDVFGISTAAGVIVPYYIDNVRIAKGTQGAVTLTAPLANATIASSASLALAATAEDADGVARVDFYQGAEKIGEDAEAPFALQATAPAAAGIYAYSARVIDALGEEISSAPVIVRIATGVEDEFDALRHRWKTLLTGGDDFTMDSNVQNRINAVTATAQGHWTSMNKAANRTALWSDLASTTVSAQITSTYDRLRSMALAWATHGSTLEGSSALLGDIVSGLEWMQANRYHAGRSIYDNWWDWEIGTPQRLLDTVVLIHDELTPTQIYHYAAAVERFTPNGVTSPAIGTTTGANRVWEVGVVALRAVLMKEGSKLAGARDGFSPVFNDVNSGDGFYADGSFIQHGRHPYTGGYGQALLVSLSAKMYWLAGSPWEITDPDRANIYRWMRDAFEPLVYRGAFMDMARGREISRSGAQDHAPGHNVIARALLLAEMAPPAEAAELRSMAKGWILSDTYRSYIGTASLPNLLLGRAVLNDSTVLPKPELIGHWNFAKMDRVVHRRPSWGFALSMRSSRIYNYESINSENLKAWHTGDGATFLYTADLGQFTEFWSTVNPYRLPGTTVDTVTRTNGQGQSTTNGMAWAGGARLEEGFGAAGMDFAAQGVTLTARKSWFMFDDEVVALGAGINSTDNRPIETVVENRKIAGTETFAVEGAAQPTTLGWTGNLSGATWCHLADTGGYYFPAGGNLRALREGRSGSWSAINGGGSTATVTRNYLTLWFDHGASPANATYAYALLPTKTASDTSAYAEAPEFQILANTPLAQGVRETTLGLEAVNFWTDSVQTVGRLTCNRKASVIIRKLSGRLDVAVADPTQLNTGSIIVEIAQPATAVLASHAAVTVQQLSPTIRLSINTNGSGGGSRTVSLSLPQPSVSISAAPASAAELGAVAGAFTVTRANTATGSLTVPYAISGSAQNGIDYQALSEAVTFADGEAAKTIHITPLRDTLAEGDETVQLTLAPSADYTLSASAIATVIIADKPFDKWRFARGLAGSPTSGNADHDLYPDLLEYALGLEPLIAEATPSAFPSVSREDGRLTLRYQRLRDAAEIGYQVEVSSDLEEWKHGATFVEETLQPDGVTVIARDLAPSDAPHRHIRLRIDLFP